jgi:hypothetical protein
MVGTSRVLREAGWEVVFQEQVGCALLEHARSALATEAYDWGADVLLFVDDDVVITNPERALGLVEAAHQLQSMVAAPVLISGGAKYNVTFLEPDPFEPLRLVKAKDCGMGCTAVSRHVLERIIEADLVGPRVTFAEGWPKLWPFFRSILNEHVWLGEDTSFTYYALQALGTDHVWADTRCQPQHWGMQLVLPRAGKWVQ